MGELTNKPRLPQRLPGPPGACALCGAAIGPDERAGAMLLGRGYKLVCYDAEACRQRRLWVQPRIQAEETG